MTYTKQQVENRVRRYAAFRPFDQAAWDGFVRKNGSTDTGLFDGDHEVAFVIRLGQELQERYKAKLAANQELTSHEVMLAADSVDYVGRSKEAHQAVVQILWSYWEHWERLPRLD